MTENESGYHEPMKDETLEMVRALLVDDGRQWGDYSQQELFRVGWSAQLLLAEIDRLRAENAAMRRMVEAIVAAQNAVTDAEMRWHQVTRTDSYPESEVLQADQKRVTALRTRDESIEQARAFLAAHPTRGKRGGAA